MTRDEIIAQIEKLNPSQRKTMRREGGVLGQIIHVGTFKYEDGSATVHVIREYEKHTTSHFVVMGPRGAVIEAHTERHMKMDAA